MDGAGWSNVTRLIRPVVDACGGISRDQLEVCALANGDLAEVGVLAGEEAGLGEGSASDAKCRRADRRAESMKMATIREVKAKLSEYLELARDDVIVITRHGRAAAVLQGIEPADLEAARTRGR